MWALVVFLPMYVHRQVHRLGTYLVVGSAVGKQQQFGAQYKGDVAPVKYNMYLRYIYLHLYIDIYHNIPTYCCFSKAV